MDLKRIDEVPYFLDVFDRRVRELPDSIMLVDDIHTGGLTRRQVDDMSGRVYTWLTRQGIGREDFVLICMPRGIWAVVAMIGVWKAGAALTVVEDNYAAERIEFIKNDCGCKAVIDLESWRKISKEQPKKGYVEAGLHDAAFAVYTSGSSGTPKGVLHEYGNIKLNTLAARSPEGPRTGKDSRIALIAPLNFVAATKTILGLLYGAYSLYIIPYTISKNPIKLKKYYRETKITNTFLSPSIIRATGGDISPWLKVVHTGSEPANGVFLEGVELVNNYSMSEGAFTLCQFVMKHAYDVCPVGKPNYDDLKIHLLDKDGNEVVEGHSGEICFENPFFRGYINMPEETSKVLKDGLYHSGDLGKWDEDGNLVLLGRTNDMIKINGNRIEPAEIEAAFKAVTDKDWCAVRGFEKPEQSFIALYYQGDMDKSTEVLRDQMGEKLPYYMIPAYFIHVDEIPLLPNGKLDKKALPEPYKDYVRGEYVPPRNELEKKLCKAFEKVLGIEKVGITENFYELGGSSLTAMEVLVEMNLDDLSAVDIFQGATASKIVSLYEAKVAEKEDISEEDKEERARLVPHSIPPVQVNVLDFQLFSPKAPMWIFPFLFSFGKEADQNRIYEAARKIMEWHPIFSTVFEFNEDCALVQRFDPTKRSDLIIEHMSDAEFEEMKKKPFPVFQLLGEPMVRLQMIVTDSDTLLLITFHHIVMDGSSIQIIFNNLARAYAGEDLVLDTYYSYLEDEDKVEGTAAYEEAHKYYQESYDGIDWCENIEPDKMESGNINATFPIETKLTPEKLETLEKNCNISRNGFISAVTLLSMAKQSSKKDVLTSFVFNNRADQRKKTAGGLLARTIPVGVRLGELQTLADLYEAIRRQSADGIGNCIYDWVILRENPYVNDILPVVYETSSITGFGFLSKMGATMAPLDAHNEAALHRTMLQVFETSDNISILLSYMATRYSVEKIEEYAGLFSNYADMLIDISDPGSLNIDELLK